MIWHWFFLSIDFKTSQIKLPFLSVLLNVTLYNKVFYHRYKLTLILRFPGICPFMLKAQSDLLSHVCFTVRLMSPMALETLPSMWLATWGRRQWLPSWWTMELMLTSPTSAATPLCTWLPSPPTVPSVWSCWSTMGQMSTSRYEMRCWVSNRNDRTIYFLVPVISIHVNWW